LLPICSHCKSIRDDSAYWHQVEDYVSNTTFAHDICPKCYEIHLQPEMKRMQEDRVLTPTES
jgi:hypothetical protein